MPANLTPDYFKAEQWHRSASTNEEKILAMEQTPIDNGPCRPVHARSH